MAVQGGVGRGRGGGEFGFERGITVLVLDHAAFLRMNLPGGMTYRFVRNLGIEIEGVAKANLRPGHGYATGHLAESIGSSATPAGEAVVGNVRASASYAKYVHDGTAPHHIRAKFGGALKFTRYSYNTGKVKKFVFKYPRGVNHPGHPAPNPFLTDAMNSVLIERGITL